MNLMDRTRPLVAVVFRVPLFVEAVTAAFDGIAEVQPVRAMDGALGGLLDALRPDAIVAEGIALPTLHWNGPMVQVDLEAQTLSRLEGGVWRPLDLELSGESIRNVVLDSMVSSEAAV